MKNQITEWLRKIKWPIIISLSTLIISTIALLKSCESINISQEANQISESALEKAESQFFTLNRPLLVVEPIRFGPNNKYFDITILNSKSIKISALMLIENAGELIAGNVFIHSTNCILYLRGMDPINFQQKYERLNENDNLSVLDIPPSGSVKWKTEYEIKIPKDINIESYIKIPGQLGVGINILLYYYKDLRQQSLKAANQYLYASNITNHILPDWYSTAMQKFSSPKLSN